MRVCFSLKAPGNVAELFFNIRYWHLADISLCAAHVCIWR